MLPRRFASVQVQGVTCGSKWRIINRGGQGGSGYDDCKRIAEQSGRPVKDILEEAMLAFRRTQAGTKRTTKTRMSRRCYPNTSSRKTALLRGRL